MSNLFDISSDRSYNSGMVVDYPIKAGTPIESTSIGVRNADATLRIDGIALAPKSSDLAPEDEEDDGNIYEYQPEDPVEGTEADRLVFGCNTQGDVFKGLSSTDDSSNSPSINDADVVGIHDMSTDAPSSSGFIEEGYTNNGTTFNRDNGNFKAVGIADIENGKTVEGFGELFTVERRTDLN